MMKASRTALHPNRFVLPVWNNLWEVQGTAVPRTVFLSSRRAVFRKALPQVVDVVDRHSPGIESVIPEGETDSDGLRLYRMGVV